MGETLFHAYTPLILWMSLGLLFFKFLPAWIPRFLGRALFWVGLPLELIALARRDNFNQIHGDVSFPVLAPIITVAELAIGFVVALLVLWIWKQFKISVYGRQLNKTKDENSSYPFPSVPHSPLSTPDSQFPIPSSPLPTPYSPRSVQGSFILASVLGNTGFVGLAIAPELINGNDLDWAVVFSIAHNVIGPYGVGVFTASYFSHSQSTNHWWIQLRDLLTVPALWAFIFGYLTQSIPFPPLIESGLQGSVSVVIASAFVLTGIRLAQLKGWKSLQVGLAPAILRVIVIPLIVGVAITFLLDLSGSQRLAMVLMSGMPSAFVGLILAEEYNLDRDLIASSIIISTVLLLLMLPVWIAVFG
jgi:malate permease and related proteins